jgi:3-phenylpropionate/trans-cinnamate dioxygenase ferredoxin subunit
MADFITIAKLSDVHEGQILALDVNETPIGVTIVNGKVCAFGDICTHDDGPLNEGEIVDQCVVCPRHGAKFDLMTGKQTFPAAAPIPIYECKVEGEEVKIKL